MGEAADATADGPTLPTTAASDPTATSGGSADDDGEEVTRGGDGTAATTVAGSEDDGPDLTTGCVESSYFLDADGDGHGDPLGEVVACAAPAGHVPLGDDCDDANGANAPSLVEVCDGQDNNCDGQVDEGLMPTAECESCTFQAFAGHTYAFCPNPALFADARTSCMTLGGDLLKVDDQAEQDFLVATPFPASAGLGGYFVGLSDQATEGMFVWTDGTAPAVTPWNPGEPNDSGGAEDCVEMTPGTGVWNDIGCDAPRAYVCEAPPP